MSGQTDVGHARPEEGVAAFDAAPADELRPRLHACLGVDRWVEEVLRGRPYADREALLGAADLAARELDDTELASALAGHPRIGERASAPEHDAARSAKEQSGVDTNDAEVARALRAGNAAYEERFDRVFLIRAAGRSAAEILAELRRRLDNDDDAERAETVDQLRQIALLRLEGLL
ncbi:2-oxo-4-hydroxy-4-carboxy-5-ureidoimidazoline decarboxylase [Intrasporangium flavum]|uniref:2-oxo-4-hydroxy-4-carboxy-5-ureidoimidazoline decarboxylase n=1 Tax=Intrasporangium flavum TaxID=1428657 RepID=UPI00096E8390|nr:2-oxo-4-hydroxy-4-carboxy-5-ureidoimidazoline decarboxylase [Intrasporangium flavum]